MSLFDKFISIDVKKNNVKKEKTSSETDIVIASDNVYTFTCEITEIGEELGIDKQKITEMFSVLGTEE